MSAIKISETLKETSAYEEVCAHVYICLCVFFDSVRSSVYPETRLTPVR